MCSLVIKFIIMGLLLESAFVRAKKTEKRGIPDFGFSSFAGGFNTLSSIPQDFLYGFPSNLPPQPVPVFIKANTPSITIQKPYSYQAPVSTAEIAHAISAAKDASTRVQYAQQRVQAAKEAVLVQQRIAIAKEAAAAHAQQQSEAAAAVQRQTASAAAHAVIMAQQKLAEAKSEVAGQQRIAAAKESYAATIIQRSATAAAAEIQRTEDTAAKIAALRHAETAAAIKHVQATKDASLTATATAVTAVSSVYSPQHTPVKYHPWN